MPRYRRQGIRISGMPQVTTAGLEQSSRSAQALSQQLDRVSNFAFRQAEVQAGAEGREYGALNAPTQQQLEDAIAAGEDVSELLPGDTRSAFGRAARGTALDAMATQFETNARTEIARLQSQFENQEIGLDEFGSQMTNLVSQQTEVLKQASPQAAQKFSASTGVVTNSAYLSAAKTQAKRNRDDYEIQLRANFDAIVRNAETIVRAGPTIDEDGNEVTVNQKINTLRDELTFAAQEIDDPEFLQSKLDELNTAVSEAKIGVVMDEAMMRPAQAFRILSGDGKFDDVEVQATFESMDNKERRALFDEVNDALSEKDSRDSRADARNARDRSKRSDELQAQFTGALLEGDEDRAQTVLDDLRNIDPQAWEQKSAVLATDPGTDRSEVVVNLRRRSLNNDLTLEDIDQAYNDGNLSLSSYKTFVSDLEQQRNQNYNRAIDWLKSNRGVPEGTLINFSAIQQKADREVAEIKVELLEQLDKDPSLNAFDFVKREVARLVQEGGSAADAVLRKQADQIAAQLRVELPGASAQELLDALEADPDLIANDQKRQNAIDNLLPVLIQIEAGQ